MRRAVFRAGGLLLAFGVLGVFSICQAETWQLKFMPKVPKSSEADGKKYPQSYYFRGSPQHFQASFNTGQKPVDPAEDPLLQEFREIVTKEPTYVSKNPLKGVIKFGNQRFVFAMDVIPKEEPKEEETKKSDAKADSEKTEAKKDDKAEAKKDDKAKAKEADKTEAKKELTEAEKKKAALEKKKAAQEKRRAERKKKQAEMKKLLFNRLYFDLNANGDLTDDEPIAVSSLRAYPPNFGRSAFEATLPIEQDGKKFEVPCNLEANMNSWSHTITTPDGKKKKIQQKHFYAQFYTSCFREGEIKLDDKAYRVILIDYNNNGVFNDTSEVMEVSMWRGEGQPPRKENHVQLGDAIYIFPADLSGRPRFVRPGRPGGEGEVNPLSVGELIGAIGGKFWNLKVTPLGDEMTITPSTEALGFVQNKGKSFTLSAFNKDKKSYMSLVSDETGKASLPPGEWVLTGYSMTFEKEAPKAEEPKAEEAKKEGAKKTDAQKTDEEKIAGKLIDIFVGKKKASESPKAGKATVMARLPGTDDSNIKVAAGETTELKFGGPYKIVVNSNFMPFGNGKSQIRLSLDIVGAMGESCSDIRLDGGRPPKPTFVISTKDGKEVESGAFEYG